MKESKTETRQKQSAERTSKAALPVCGICLVLCAFVLFYSFRMYRTAEELLHAATAVPPTVLWYEDAAQSTVQETVSEQITNFAQAPDESQNGTTYVLNTGSKKIHSPTCRYAKTMQETNKQVVTNKTLEQLLSEGYSKCSVCNAE